MPKWGSIVGGVLLIIASGVFIVSTSVTRLLAQATPTVIINELAWAGSTSSPSDEWIELLNTTESEIDISNWQLTKITSDEERLMLTIPEATLIPANGYFLISNFASDNSALDIEPNLIRTAVALSNSSLQIKLYDGDFETEAALIDTAWDGTAPQFGSNPLKISMERDRDGVGWHDASETINFDEGVTDLGTPLALNSVVTLPPTLVSVQPSVAINDIALEIEEIIGTNFSQDLAPTLKLVLDAQEIVASDVNVATDILIDQAIFNIEEAEVGIWDLVLTNPDGKIATLPNAITIAEPEIQPDMTTTIRIYEIYPKPSTTSNDEFIELYNFGDTTIDLTGWKLDDTRDGGSNAYNFVRQTLSPKSFLVLYKPTSRLTLNDNGDSVSLIQPNGFVLDEIAYESAKRGESLSRFDSGFEWTETITPNGENVFFQTADELPEDEMEEEDEPEPTEEPVMTYEIDDLLITELLPNPTDSQEEFIEIFNNSAQDISLLGWKLRDKSGKSFTIGENDVQIQSTLIIKPNQFVYITQSSSKIHLNNTGGEMVELISPNDVVITSVSYPDKAPAGASYSHFATDKWTWTSQPTPGKINIVILDEETEIILEPTVFLPSVGVPWYRWMGIGLMSFFLASMLMWYKRNNEIYHK